MIANVYSKSMLRAVAGELFEDYSTVYYFPSLEIINARPSGGMFFEPDFRTINLFGVKFCDEAFFSGGALVKEFAESNAESAKEEIDLRYDEETLHKST